MAVSAAQSAEGGRPVRDPMARDRLATRLALLVILVFWIVSLPFFLSLQPWLAALITGLILILLQVVRVQLGVRISMMTIVLGILSLLLFVYNLFIGPINILHPIIPWTSILLVIFVLVMLFGETFLEGRLN